MADHFLGKTQVAAADFVEADGQSVLDRHAELRALLAERAGPETAALFAEPLVSRGNDTAPPTVSWYAESPGDPRPLTALDPAEQARAERWIGDHLRPLRALADDPELGPLVQGALSLYGKDDIVLVGDRPVIRNWGLVPGGNGAPARARPAHYASTMGRFLPLADADPRDAGPVASASGAARGGAAGVGMAAGAAMAGGARASGGGPGGGSGGPSEPNGASRPDRRPLPAVAWVPLLVLLVMAGAVLAWLLLPGTRLFHDRAELAVTEADTLAATRALNDALRAREAVLEAAIAGAVCRDDGLLILPGGLTPEGLTPPAPGEPLPRESQAAPDALLPNTPERVVLPGPDGGGDPTRLLDWIEARTVLVMVDEGAGLTTGSGFIVGPGLIVTNDHVIADAVEGGIVVTGGALAAPEPAEVIKRAGPLEATGEDFALLRIATTDAPAFDVHLPEGSLKLTNVIAAGFPGDVLEMDFDFAALRAGDRTAVPDLTVTDGTVNTEQRIGPQARVLMHSAPLSSGNSGGPLVDLCGRVVGVNSFVRQGRLQNRSYALPSGDLIAFLEGTPAQPEVTAEACAPRVLWPQVQREGETPAAQPAAPDVVPAPQAAPQTAPGQIPLPLPGPSE